MIAGIFLKNTTKRFGGLNIFSTFTSGSFTSTTSYTTETPHTRFFTKSLF